jgi:hypothetical protein
LQVHDAGKSASSYSRKVRTSALSTVRLRSTAILSRVEEPGRHPPLAREAARGSRFDNSDAVRTLLVDNGVHRQTRPQAFARNEKERQTPVSS